MPIGIIVNGSTYTFDNATYGYALGADGFGMPPVDRYSMRGAQQHGSTDLGYRLNERRVSLVIGMPVDTEAEFYAARARLLKLFHPDNTVTVLATNGASLDRRMDVAFESAMDMPIDKEWKMQKVVVTMKTIGLPAWYDATARSQLFEVGGGAGSFVVPMEIPHSVGSSIVNANVTISYPGTWEEYPRIKITGPVADCKIVNNTTGETLDFTGYTLPTGHYLELDLRYGYKTVLYDGTTNYIDKLTTASNLATFHMAPCRPEESARDNSITVTGTSATNLTKIEVFWNNRYIGL